VTEEVHVVRLVRVLANGGELLANGVETPQRTWQRAQTAGVRHGNGQPAGLHAGHGRLGYGQLVPTKPLKGHCQVKSKDRRQKAQGQKTMDVTEILAWLQRKGTKKNRDGMARYAIVAPKAFGVSMATMQQLTKKIGRDHALAAALWKTGWYEARMLTAFVDE